jgi:hypothetical protein
MSDRQLAEEIGVANPNMTWEQVIDKYTKEGFKGDDLWRAIIGASQKSRTSVNESLGVTPPKK